MQIFSLKKEYLRVNVQCKPKNLSLNQVKFIDFYEKDLKKFPLFFIILDKLKSLSFEFKSTLFLH